jgi:hypothetical protein
VGGRVTSTPLPFSLSPFEAERVLATLPLASKIRKRTLFSTSKFSDIQGASWTVGSIGSKAATRRRRRRRRRIRIRQDIDVIVRFGNAVAR